MKNIRKVLGILAIFILVTGVKCHAAGIQENPTDTEMNNSAIIKSVTITPEMREYAKNILSVHLAQNENAISFGSNLKQFRLGKIVSVYNKNNDDIIFLAPIVRRGKIVATLEIEQEDNEFESQMSTEYVDQLTEIAKTKVNGTYVLMYLDNDLIKTSISEDENSVPDSYIKRLSSEINISDFLYNIENIVIDSPEYPDEKPIVRQLNVTPVKQEGPTCWAATCACIINYYENTSKTAQELARSIYGKDWKRESIWTEYVQLYHRNGLYPTLNGVLQFSKVKENINNGNPMHLLLEGHAVALIGYKEWKKSLNNNGDNKVLILMNPSMGGIRTVTLNKSGNFYYSGKDAWKYTGVF